MIDQILVNPTDSVEVVSTVFAEADAGVDLDEEREVDINAKNSLISYGIRSAYADGKYPCRSFPIFPNNQLSSCCCVGSTLNDERKTSIFLFEDLVTYSDNIAHSQRYFIRTFWFIIIQSSILN